MGASHRDDQGLAMIDLHDDWYAAYCAGVEREHRENLQARVRAYLAAEPSVLAVELYGAGDEGAFHRITTVRFEGGWWTSTDESCPFAETEEQVLRARKMWAMHDDLLGTKYYGGWPVDGSSVVFRR